MLSQFKRDNVYDNVALTAQNISKSESSSLRKPEITPETDDDTITSIRTPAPFLTVAFVIEIT
jgi:hypothetical protein